MTEKRPYYPLLIGVVAHLSTIIQLQRNYSIYYTHPATETQAWIKVFWSANKYESTRKINRLVDHSASKRLIYL